MSVIVFEMIMDVRLFDPVKKLFLKYGHKSRSLSLCIISCVVDMNKENQHPNINRLLTILCLLRSFARYVVLGGIERQKRNQDVTALNHKLILHVSRLLRRSQLVTIFVFLFCVKILGWLRI